MVAETRRSLAMPMSAPAVTPAGTVRTGSVAGWRPRVRESMSAIAPTITPPLAPATAPMSMDSTLPKRIPAVSPIPVPRPMPTPVSGIAGFRGT
jgi:hypothetical protein